MLLNAVTDMPSKHDVFAQKTYCWIQRFPIGKVRAKLQQKLMTVQKTEEASECQIQSDGAGRPTEGGLVKSTKTE